MSLPTPKFPTTPKTAGSFLEEWSEHKVPTYILEYGGERAGVPKGEDIPFPIHKVKAAVALLQYGAPKRETLSAIARTVGVTSALLRVWRTEERFLTLYRRAVWECADDFLRLLAANWEEPRPSPSEEFQSFFGIALQESIIRRLCVDVVRMVPEWRPLGRKPRWSSECTLVGEPVKPPPHFSYDEVSLVKSNAIALLGNSPSRLYTREPGLAHWASLMLTRQWIFQDTLKEACALLEKGRSEQAVEQIKWVTSHSPLDDLETLHRLVDQGT
ncbi:hypothetical protein [Nitrospira sp. Nam74]